MKDEKKLVKDITSRDVDFAKWYTDIIKKAQLASYSGIKGCMVIRPYAYAIWEAMKSDLDRRFKELGHENIYMPMFIPESLLQKEKDHVEGFAPEVAWVTQGGSETLTEKLCVRPTSETLFCEHYRDIIHSYRDLPKLYNQWCSVVRWEKTTRPFLRTSEFLWQEGHTMHETKEEAMKETLDMLEVYKNFYKETLAIPAVCGQKTEKEKFAGAVSTYTIEPMMHNGVALQGGTTHYFGQGFAKSFDIKFTGRDNKLEYPYQTSWGVSSRMIGAIIMVHSDDDGLVLPPYVAPIQVVIVPIMQKKPQVLAKCQEIYDSLNENYKVKLDDSNNTPGFKFSEYEMKGVPIRIEIGPRDLEKNQCVLVRRDTREKTITSLENLNDKIKAMLADIHNSMYEKALNNLKEKTYVAKNHDEFLKIAKTKTGFIKAMSCSDPACEEKLKEETGGFKSRCIPFKQEHIADTCVCCGKKAKYQLYFGKQY